MALNADQMGGNPSEFLISGDNFEFKVKRSKAKMLSYSMLKWSGVLGRKTTYTLLYRTTDIPTQLFFNFNFHYFDFVLCRQLSDANAWIHSWRINNKSQKQPWQLSMRMTFLLHLGTTYMLSLFWALICDPLAINFWMTLSPMSLDRMARWRGDSSESGVNALASQSWSKRNKTLEASPEKSGFLIKWIS